MIILMMVNNMLHDYLDGFDMNVGDQVVDSGSPKQLPTELNRQLRLHRAQKLGLAGGEAVETSRQLRAGVVGCQAGG